MAEVQLQRERFRAKRVERDNLPVIAIVGYTNAGKSTLLNTLCDAEEVYADDLLFATLDPTTRLVRLPQGREVLLSDTVGFIQKLPTRLIASFRATLDELEDASIVLHVVDASSPFVSQQIWSVQQIIIELGQQKTPQILVLNKADKAGVGVSLDALGAAAEAAGALVLDAPTDGASVLAGAEFGRLPRGAPIEAWWLKVHPELTPACAVIISAKTGDGLVDLLETIESALRTLSIPVEVLVPYAAGDVLAEIHRDGTIALEEFREVGTYVRAHVPRSLFNKLSKYVVSSKT
jgi:GTP-binding protein HflX